MRNRIIFKMASNFGSKRPSYGKKSGKGFRFCLYVLWLCGLVLTFQAILTDFKARKKKIYVFLCRQIFWVVFLLIPLLRESKETFSGRCTGSWRILAWGEGQLGKCQLGKCQLGKELVGGSANLGTLICRISWAQFLFSFISSKWTLFFK